MNAPTPPTPPTSLAPHRGRGVLPNADTDADTTTPTPQTLVSHGYKNCLRRTYVLRWADPAPGTAPNAPPSLALDTGHIRLARAQRAACLAQVQALASGVQTGGFIALDIGLTYPGLQQLDVSADLLQVFRRKSPAFYEGAWARASQRLGDTGPSQTAHWRRAYHPSAPQGEVHWVLLAHFGLPPGPSDASSDTSTNINSTLNPIDPQACRSAIVAFERALLALLGCPAQAAQVLQADWVEQACPLDRAGSVWFGYKDGITSPRYSAQANGHGDYSNGGEHALGELLLGHPRNTGDRPFAQLGLPLQPATSDSLQPQSLSRRELQRLHFFKNSSFGVLRSMQQDVAAFEQWVAAQVQRSGEPAAWVKAKIMGRVPNPSQGLPLPRGLPPGTRLTPAMRPEHLQDSGSLHLRPLGQEAGYHRPPSTNGPDPEHDAQGQGCPFASHIRRMNPRDDPVVPFFARPLLRRSLPYGQAHESDKGLAGLFFCSDIERQFEHLLGHWANDRVLGVPSSGKDPIIGNHEPVSAGPLGLHRPFVITRACLYAWFPTVQVLQTLADYRNASATATANTKP